MEKGTGMDEGDRGGNREKRSWAGGFLSWQRFYREGGLIKKVWKKNRARGKNAGRQFNDS